MTSANVGVPIGVDGEMSAADLAQGGALIQAGAAAWSGEPGGPVDVFTSVIRGPVGMWWDPRAAQVHRLPRAVVDAGPPADEVDDAFTEWLLAHGGVDGQRVMVPVGFNVGAFDRPFFAATLPRATGLLSRRCVDLNGICMTYAGWDPNPRAEGSRSWAGWKRSMVKAADVRLQSLGVAGGAHDAGYDAAQALLGWWWLRQQLPARVSTGAAPGDPLGPGLRARLAGVPVPVIDQIIADVGPGRVRRWFGTHHPLLGTAPLLALSDDRVGEVLAAAAVR